MQKIFVLIALSLLIFNCNKNKEQINCFFKCGEIMSNNILSSVQTPGTTTKILNKSNNSIVQSIEEVIVKDIIKYGSLKEVKLLNNDSILYTIGILDSILVTKGQKLNAGDSIGQKSQNKYIVIRAFNKHKIPISIKNFIKCNC